MKRFLLLFLLVPASAVAQPTELEQACIKVARDFNLSASLTLGVVQSFPDLVPPGVRLTYSTRKEAKPEDIDDELECEFRNKQPPFDLQSFCLSKNCYSADSKEPKEKRRFEEIQSLQGRTSN